MTGEVVVNARRLTGDGPLWMLHEAGAAGEAGRLRLIVSDEATAGSVLEALRGCGVPAGLDPIGGEYHILCQLPPRGRDALKAYLDNPGER
jgi:hypothetical protein